MLFYSTHSSDFVVLTIRSSVSWVSGPCVAWRSSPCITTSWSAWRRGPCSTSTACKSSLWPTTGSLIPLTWGTVLQSITCGS
ncbi:hypothetical protein E2C01_069871 [Portunus trituberculatus]|uniref:Uncharacterized protein n=1 Tax=Portunus trituberculatus TaxID=210409 RepID=A0A5B7HVQ1_PORTR|nr:hypothetical protein [Portunus trituberculatus]